MIKAAEHQQDFGCLKVTGWRESQEVSSPTPAQSRASSELTPGWNPPGTGMAQTAGVSCSTASLPMGTPQQKLLLKPSPNLLQLVALISHPASPRCREGPGSLSTGGSKGHPLSRLPLLPHSLLTVPLLQPHCSVSSQAPSSSSTSFLCQVTKPDAVSGWGLTGVTQTGTIPSLDHLAALLLTLPRLFVSSSSHQKKLHQGYKEAKPPYGFKMNISTSTNSREAIFPN